jgi:phage tail-like protein
MGSREEPRTPSRRDALKLAGAAALGGVAVSLTEVASGSSAGAATIVSGRVAVTIDGVPVDGLVSVVPFVSASSSIEQPSPTLKGTVSEPGDLVTHGAVITRQWTPTSDWLAWRMSVVNGQVDRRNVVVRVFDTKGHLIMKHVYLDCWVQEYTYPELHSHGHDPCTEKVTLRPEGLAIQ